MANTARMVGGESWERALLIAFQKWTEKDVNEQYWREKFEDEYKYEGPITIRKKKPPAGNPRDILDTEELYKSGVKSYDYSADGDGARADWHWDAENSSDEQYAWFVHEGQGPHSREPRRWTDELASEYLFEGSEIERRLLNRIEKEING